MTKYVVGWEFGDELSKIIGINGIRTVDFHFAIEDPVSADVNFLLSDVQAAAVVKLFRDGKWRSDLEHAD